MARTPSLLGLDATKLASIADYYEFTMADTDIVAGIDGREAVFNAAVRGMRPHKVIWEGSLTSDGKSIGFGGKKLALAEEQPELAGRKFDLYEVQKDNYLLNFGLEQILAFLQNWEVREPLLKVFSDKKLSHETIRYFEKNKRLDLSADAIPEGIPIFAHERYISLRGPFEQCQFPESFLLGAWGYQTAVATQASYVLNILEEFGRQDIVTLEGGSRRAYPAAAIAATRAALGAGFSGTSLVNILEYYPEEALGKVGGSSAHSAILHIGSDEAAFEMQLKAYYRINDHESPDLIKEKIRRTGGAGPTFLIDTFDSTEGLKAAMKVMKKYGIQCQVRNDSGDAEERVKYIRMTLDEHDLPKAKVMISDDLKPWRVRELLDHGARFDVLLMGTYLVNPYKLPGAVYKNAADQRDPQSSQLVPCAKVCANNPAKGTLPGEHDIYRIIGADGFADRDVILLRGVDSISRFVKPGEEALKLNTQVMKHGELTYDVPDLCQVIETSKTHRALLRPEHRRFIGATEYPVIISQTIEDIQQGLAAQYATGRL